MTTRPGAAATVARGLTADYLHGWLAALGITAAAPGTRLSWTTEPTPKAVLHHPGGRPAQRIAVSLSDLDPGRSAVAYSPTDGPSAGTELPRNPTREQYAARAAHARKTHDPSLAASLTDLCRTPADKLEGSTHSPFDPALPAGRTVHFKLLAALSSLRETTDGFDPVLTEAAVTRTLEGHARRTPGSGLGFDARSRPAQATPDGRTQPFTDPVLELLAYHAVLLHPVRGTGHTGAARTRGWAGPPGTRNAYAWPAWTDPLDRWAADALLDRYHHARTAVGNNTALPARTAELLRVHAEYATVAYQPTADKDPTRYYASERLGRPGRPRP